MFKQFKQVNPFKPCRDGSDLVHSAPGPSPKSAPSLHEQTFGYFHVLIFSKH